MRWRQTKRLMVPWGSRDQKEHLRQFRWPDLGLHFRLSLRPSLSQIPGDRSLRPGRLLLNPAGPDGLCRSRIHGNVETRARPPLCGRDFREATKRIRPYLREGLYFHLDLRLDLDLDPRAVDRREMAALERPKPQRDHDGDPNDGDRDRAPTASGALHWRAYGIGTADLG
jgi:hypothetical protein